MAQLVPVQHARLSQAEVDSILADIDSLAAEIRTRGPAGVSAVDGIREGRRDL